MMMSLSSFACAEVADKMLADNLSPKVATVKEETIKDFDEQNIQSVFEDKIISSCEYIYNLDDNADYIIDKNRFSGKQILFFSRFTL